MNQVYQCCYHYIWANFVILTKCFKTKVLWLQCKGSYSEDLIFHIGDWSARIGLAPHVIMDNLLVLYRELSEDEIWDWYVQGAFSTYVWRYRLEGCIADNKAPHRTTHFV